MDAKLGSTTYGKELARATGAWPAVVLGDFLADQGVLPVGLILTERDTGYEQQEAVADENVGTGNGTDKTFTATLAKAPALVGSVEITDGTETFSDDGLGRLTGSAGGSGTVVYDTGAVSVTFNAAPADESAITADYETKIAGVLDGELDTSVATSGGVLIMGPVANRLLKVGKVAEAAPSAAMLKRLCAMGIIPV